MTELNFSIEQDDLKALFVHTRVAYGNMTFGQWVEEVKSAYSIFATGKSDVRTFSQWVNAQIIALT
jgi:hypothetical protein